MTHIYFGASMSMEWETGKPSKWTQILIFMIRYSSSSFFMELLCVPSHVLGHVRSVLFLWLFFTSDILFHGTGALVSAYGNETHSLKFFICWRHTLVMKITVKTILMQVLSNEIIMFIRAAEQFQFIHSSISVLQTTSLWYHSVKLQAHEHMFKCEE